MGGKTHDDAGSGRDAGDTFATALPIQPGVYESNWVSRDDKVDTFKIEVPKGGVLKVAATRLEAHVSVEILGELGEILGKTSTGGQTPYESVPFTASQTVFIKVKAIGGGGTYSLGVLVK